MTKLSLGMAAVLAFLSGACSDDGGETNSATGGAGGTGGSAGSGGQAGAGGSAGSAGAPSCVGTQSTDEKFSQALQVLRDALETQKIPGGAIAIIKDGKLLNLGVAGSKRASVCDPITPDTLFRTTFATELITTLGVLDATEDGLLSLDAPITDVVTTLGVPDAEQITLHHLLSETSMYRADYECTSLSNAFTNPKNALVQAPPGTMQAWNPANFELAGLALEIVDKKPFDDTITERVLGPLAMGGAFTNASIVAKDHSLGHSAGPTEMPVQANCRRNDPSTEYYGSIRDLAKLLEYLTGGAGQILEPATLDSMLSEQGVHWASDSYMVYGADGALWFGEEVLWRGSHGVGFGLSIYIYKQRGLSFVTLLNAEFGDVGVITDAVAQIYDDSIEPFFSTPPVPASFPTLEGIYKDDVGFNGISERTLEVFVDPTDDTKLIGTLAGPNGVQEPVWFEGSCCADNFALKDGFNGYDARFWRDASGNGYAISLQGDNGPPFFRQP